MTYDHGSFAKLPDLLAPLCKNCIFMDEPIEKDPCRECYKAFLAQRIKPNFIRRGIKQMPNEPIFRISETLYIPVMVDRITQFSDAPTKYYIRMPAGIDYFMSDSPAIAIIKEDILKDVALRGTHIAIKDEAYTKEMLQNADQCGRRTIL